MRAGNSLKRLLRHFKVMPMRNVVKLAGVVLAVIVTCIPLFFWPAGEGEASTSGGRSSVVITVPPVVVVPGVLSTSGASTSSTSVTIEPPVEITIAAVGDIIVHDSVRQAAWNRKAGEYDFWPMFAPVSAYLSSADYTVCNLEMRLAGSAAGYSSYPRMNSPSSLADALAAAGIDLAATANNHTMDMGWQGLVSTLDRLDAAGIAHPGSYRSLEEKQTPLIIDIKGVKVAFLNYTDTMNGLPAPKGREEYAVNVLDVDAVAAEAMSARRQGADVVIALLHYGQEYSRTPTARQTEISEGTQEAEGLLGRGVDVILGANAHMVQPIFPVLQYSNSEANDTYVAYSLGNFLSGQRWRYSDSGLIAYVHIQKQGAEARVTGISYLPVYVQKTTEDRTEFRILPVLPGLDPETDTTISAREEARMDQVWEELNDMLYRPDEDILPLDPTDLGLDQ
jgi:poly-gamma-glutamate capsule biosynthesis protein CapA/YwtB (metallophosphatase superfamily)